MLEWTVYSAYVNKGEDKMPKNQTMREFNGGSFYSLTPRRILADLGVNELKANPPYPPLEKGARKLHLL